MKKIILIMLISILVLTGCTNNIEEEKLNIVTSFYPIYIATANIIDGVEGVSLSNLTSSEVGCLHDYQLTTENMMALETADVFIINGAGMESFLDKVVNSYKDVEIIDSSKDIEISEDNSHIWVSISNYIHQVENIKNELIKLDGINVDKYTQNADTYIQKLEELKARMHVELDNIEEKDMVTFHEAFYYFAEEFNLNIVTVIEREPGTSPSAGELVNIIAEIKEINVKAIFVEPQYEKTIANTISRETGIPVYTLDPVVTGDLYKEAYIDIMEQNLYTLKQALTIKR